jgi:O-antigen ligase
LNTIRLKQLTSHLLPITYAVFMLGFFLFPSAKFHSNFFYLAVAFPFLIVFFMKKVDIKSLFANRTFSFISIYLLYMFCTLFWADSLQLSDFLKYGRRVLYILIFLIVTIHITQAYPNFMQRLLVLLCWTAAIVAIANIIFFYRQHPFPLARVEGYGLLSKAFRASSIYGIIAIASVYLFLDQRSFGMRLIYLGLLLVGLCYMLLARSRTPLFSLAVALITWQFLAHRLQKMNEGSQRKRLLVVLVVIAMGTGLFFIFYPEFLQKAFTSRELIPDSRPELWGKILARVKESPWFGHGLTADPRTNVNGGKILVHPHSVYLATLLYGGVVGSFLFISLLISALWQGFGSARQPINLAAACMFLYGALCVVPNGNMLIHHVKPFWLFFWFPVALIVASDIPGHSLHDDSRT